MRPEERGDALWAPGEIGKELRGSRAFAGLSLSAVAALQITSDLETFLQTEFVETHSEAWMEEVCCYCYLVSFKTISNSLVFTKHYLNIRMNHPKLPFL